MAEVVGHIYKKEFVSWQIADCNNYVANHCNYCNNCWKCKVCKKFSQECNVKGIKTFNVNKKWWSIDWKKQKNGESLPVLRFHDKKQFSVL